MTGSGTLGVGALGGWALLGGGGGGTDTIDVAVEIAFDSGYTTPAGSRTWTDVTAYVEPTPGLTIDRGRPDQFSTPQPSRLQVTLDNTDGRFTPENVAGAYYPNVKKGRPIRVRARVNGGAWLYRYLGYIDEWPVAWPGGSQAYSTVTVTAMSRQARAGKGATLKSIVEEEILYDSPRWYFPLGEPSGSTTAGNIAPGRPGVLTATQIGTGGTLAFGAGTGPGTDDLTAPVFTPVDTTNGLRLVGNFAQTVNDPGDTVIDLECWLVTTQTSGTVAKVCTADDKFGLAISTVGGQVQADANFGGGLSQAIIASTVTDGLLHHVSARVVISGGNATASIIRDGGSRTTAGSSVALAAFPDLSRLYLGGLIVGTQDVVWAGTIAHAAVFSGTTAVADARVQAHYHAGADGFAGETSGDRIQRLARLAGIPTVEVSTETGLSTSIAHKDTTGELPAALMQAVAETEDGVVFDGKDGTLTFHARSHRYGATSAFTLSVAAGDVEGGLVPKLDDQHLTNDVTASRPNGITARSIDAASIAEYGYYRESKEILTTSDIEVQARADWQVNRFGTPRVAVPNLGVDLLTCSSALMSALLAADIGTRFTVTGLPSQAPASTMDFFIEGYSERISAESYGIEFNVSPAAYANVWILDSSTNSQLDSTTVLAY